MKLIKSVGVKTCQKRKLIPKETGAARFAITGWGTPDSGSLMTVLVMSLRYPSPQCALRRITDARQTTTPVAVPNTSQAWTRASCCNNGGLHRINNETDPRGCADGDRDVSLISDVIWEDNVCSVLNVEQRL